MSNPTETNPNGVPGGRFSMDFEGIEKVTLWGANPTGQNKLSLNVQLHPEGGGSQSASIELDDFRLFRELLEDRARRADDG